jgi:predicted phosphodiesterase
MRFAVLSDIHGNSAALDAVLDDLSREDVSAIVNLGDSLSGPLDPAGTADRLLHLRLPTVSGNHDRALIDRPPEAMGLWEAWTWPDLSEVHLDWVRSLPPLLERDGVLLCHATPAADDRNWLHLRGDDGWMRRAPADHIEAEAVGRAERLMLCGHTHMPDMVALADGRLVVNPGSVGCPAYLDGRFDPPTRMEQGLPHARYAILAQMRSGWRADFRAVPYDGRAMSERAADRGAQDWAEAILTGRVTPPG